MEQKMLLVANVSPILWKRMENVEAVLVKSDVRVKDLIPIIQMCKAPVMEMQSVLTKSVFHLKMLVIP
jgi:hypothetical protein